MIRSFRDAKTEAFFRGEYVRAFSGFEAQALKRLLWLDAAETLEDLRNIRSNRLEALSGDRHGQFSIRINRQWRICFRWEKGNALEVEIADYH
jgi:proteic killer suppression protein